MKGSFEYNGIHYVSWWHDEYLAEYSKESMDDLAATGANWAGVLTTWYQEDGTACTMQPDAEKTPSDEAIQCAVEQLRARGLKVLLKPHVDALDGRWRGEFRPTDVRQWFQSYGAFIRRCAAFGADGLVIGTELRKLTGPENRAAWCDLIRCLRDEFGGILTYAANAADVHDEWEQVSFWDEVDLIGLDAYFPVTRGWKRIIPAVERVAKRFGKPVLFTEIGYRSVSGAAERPWEHSAAGVYDPEHQRTCYEDFFRAWAPHSDWMRGAFWWNWPVAMPQADDTGYVPRGKPAAKVFRQWAIRRQIEEGRYRVDSEKVASAIVKRHLKS